MAIRLYRAGDTHVIRGIKCEFHDANEFSFEHLLKMGWRLRPEDIYNKEITDDEEKILQEVEAQWKESGAIEETPKAEPESRPKRKYVRRKKYTRKSVPLDK